MEASWLTPPKKAMTVPAGGKVMASICFYVDGILMVDYLRKDQIIIGTYHVSLFRHLRENITVKCCGKLSKVVLSG